MITEHNTPYLRRILSLLLIIAVIPLCMAVPVSAAASGTVTRNGVTFEYTGSTITKVTPDPGVTEITVPDELDGQSVSRLENGCFTDCDQVTVLDLPSEMVNLTPDTFIGLPALAAINAEPGDYLISREGALYSGRNLIYFPPARSASYFMPAYGTTKILSGALASPCLTTLELPGTFRGPLDEDLLTAKCPNLTTLILPPSLSSGRYPQGMSQQHYAPPAAFLTKEGAGNLRTLSVPDRETQLPEIQPEEKADLLIRGIDGSKAQAWAGENGYAFSAHTATGIASPMLCPSR